MAITNCNKLVTLGILDTFTSGLIQDASGNTVSVNYGGKPSTYCPTYTELTNSTYLPKYVQGTDPGSDVDGIEITGTYAPNENVRSMDLVAKYTRYNALAIGANPTEFNVSGGTSILDYELEFKRFEQTYSGTNCDSTAETSTMVSDTSLTIDWEQTPIIGEIVYPNFIISGVPSASTATLEAKVTFRNTEEVCQLPATFTFTGSHCSCDDFVLLNTPSAFTSAGTAQYIYYNAGDCITFKNTIGGTGAFRRRLEADQNRIMISGSSNNECTKSHSGTAKVEFSGDGVACSAVTIDLFQEGSCCCDCALSIGNATSGAVVTKTIWNYDEVDDSIWLVSPAGGGCLDGSYPQDVTVSCTSPHWNVVKCGTSEYPTYLKATPVSQNTGTTDIEGTINLMYSLRENNPSVGCTKRIYLTHKSQACDCSNFEFTSTPTPFPADTAVLNYAEYYSGPCISRTDVSASESWIDTSFVDGQKKVAVICDPQPSGKLSRSGTVTVEYESTGDTTCSSSATFDVSQESTCNCDDAIGTVISSPLAWGSSAVDDRMIGVDLYECFKSSGTSASLPTLITACTSNHWTVTQTYNPTGSTAFSIKPVSANTAITDIDDIFSIYYDLVENNPAGGCSKSFPLKHQGIPCTCGDFRLVNSPTAITSGGGPIQYIYYTAGTCVTATSVTASNTWIKTSLDTTNKKIALSATTIPSCNNSRSGTVTVNYSGPSCTSAVTFNVTQNSSCGCDCIGTIPTTYTWDSTATTTTTVYLNTSMACFTTTVSYTISGRGKNHWTVNKILDSTGNTQVYMTPTSVNDSFDEIQAILTINYEKAEGTTCTKTLTLIHSAKPCTCSDFEISQPDTVPSTGSSNVIVYFDKCPSITVSSNVTTGASWIHFAGITGSALYFTVDAQPANRASRNGTATVNYSTPSCTSSATITFTQESSFDCATVSGSSYFHTTGFTWANTDTTSKFVIQTLSNITALDYDSVTFSVTNPNFEASYSSVVSGGVRNTRLQVKPKAVNNTYNDKNANLIVRYNLTENNPVGGCEVTIPLKQSGKTCDSSSFEFGTIPTIPSSGCTDLEVSFYYGPCIWIEDITSNQSWLNVDYEGGEISYTKTALLTASDLGTCKGSRTATVTVSYQDHVAGINSAATFNVTQEGTCKCNCAVTGQPSSGSFNIWEANSTTSSNIVYGVINGLFNTCMGKLHEGTSTRYCSITKVDPNNHFNATLDTADTARTDYQATVTFSPKSKNTGSTDLYATVYFNYTLKNGESCYDLIYLTHFASSCSCRNVTLSSKNATFSYTGGSKTITYTLNSTSTCGDPSSLLGRFSLEISPASAATWITTSLTQTSSSKQITLSVCKNVDSSDRNAKVTMALDGDSCGDDQVIIVKQDGTPIKKCYGINAPLAVTCEAQTAQAVAVEIPCGAQNTPVIAVDKTSGTECGGAITFSMGAAKVYYNGSSIPTIIQGKTALTRSDFTNFTNISALTIGSTVTAISAATFSGFTSLKTLVIPDNVNTIGNEAFKGCTALTSVTLSTKLSGISTRCFSGCSSLTDISIPDSVVTISGSAFAECTSLTGITIGSGCTSLRNGAFYNCPAGEMTIYAKNPPTIVSTDVNDTITDGSEIYVPCECVQAYNNDAKWGDGTVNINAII